MSRNTDDLDPRDAYQGIEDQRIYATRADLDRYREHCLSKSEEEARFCLPFLHNRSRLLELACGNGRLLVRLAQLQHLGYGVGFDTSTSRIDFANRWIRDLNLGNQLHFGVADALQPPEFRGNFDLVICITSAFGYFAPLRKDSERDVLAWMIKQAKPGARLLFELYQYPEEIAQCLAHPKDHLRHWGELPNEDPFRFYLHERWWDQSALILSHRKYFIHRTGSIDEGHGDRQRVYTGEEMKLLCEQAGLEVEGLFSTWQGKPFQQGDESLIVLARVQ